MKRDPCSHKGENGKVAVIGGSRHMHGAPLLSALAAQKSGVDLTYVCLPACHEEAAKRTSLNFFVYPFEGSGLAPQDTEPILELLANMDSAVLGPGVDRGDGASREALDAIMEGASCALVLDAAALHPRTLTLVHGKHAVLTPHLGEVERMELEPKILNEAARDTPATILLKGVKDTVFAENERRTEVAGGNAGLTVGGTGDALAGLIAGLIAQKMEPFEACVLASTIVKKAGEMLYEKYGYAYSAKQLTRKIPEILHALSGPTDAA